MNTHLEEFEEFVEYATKVGEISALGPPATRAAGPGAQARLDVHAVESVGAG